MKLQPRHRARGVSLVEILIGLAVGLLLLTGLSSMVVGSRQTSRIERNLLEVQSSGRIAVETMAREVRKAGFRSNRERSLNDIFPLAASTFTTAGAVVTGMAATGEVNVRFQGSGDGWTTDCLGNAIGDGENLWQTLSLQSGQLVCRVRNMNTLTDQSLALIPQVEAMDISYGVDADGDGYADSYASAAAVTDWTRVASVNVQLRMVSSEDHLTDGAQPYLDFNGNAVTPTDQRLRRNFSAVIALRNLLP